jgi:hypothetical protein
MAFETWLSSRGDVFKTWVPDMPALPWFLAHSTVYLYRTETEAGSGAPDEAPGASGFLFGVRSMVHREPHQYWHVYAITAHHVTRLGLTVVRDSSGRSYRPKQWIPHPDRADLAIAPLGLRPRINDTELPIWLDHLLVSVHNPFIKVMGSPITGDDVFMLGRFSGLKDGPMNNPIARFGNIASTPIKMSHGTEIVYDQLSYLVEMRSINKFSGSPVYMYIPSTDELKGTYRDWLRGARRVNDSPVADESVGKALLLGVDCAHTREIVPGTIDDNCLAPFGVSVQMHTGLSVVTPAKYIQDMLDSDEMKERRRQDDEERRREIGTSNIVLDTTGTTDDVPGLSRDNFFAALRKVSRPTGDDSQDQPAEGKSETSE